MFAINLEFSDLDYLDYWSLNYEAKISWSSENHDRRI